MKRTPRAILAQAQTMSSLDEMLAEVEQEAHFKKCAAATSQDVYLTRRLKAKSEYSEGEVTDFVKRRRLNAPALKKAVTIAAAWAQLAEVLNKPVLKGDELFRRQLQGKCPSLVREGDDGKVVAKVDADAIRGTTKLCVDLLKYWPCRDAGCHYHIVHWAGGCIHNV